MRKTKTAVELGPLYPFIQNLDTTGNWARKFQLFSINQGPLFTLTVAKHVRSDVDLARLVFV